MNMFRWKLIILALLNVKSNRICHSLKMQVLPTKELRAAISELRRGSKTSLHSLVKDTYQSRSKYAINLIEAARNGKLDPVLGRDEENPSCTANLEPSYAKTIRS